MRIHVRISGPLRVVIGAGEIELALDGDAATVAQALDALAARYPRAQRYLRDAEGELPPGIRALAGDERLDERTALAAPLRDGDQLTLLMPTAGG
jgi:molybdopterin converting factor small subunit